MIAAGAVPVDRTNLDQFATGLNGTRSPYGMPAVFNRVCEWRVQFRFRCRGGGRSGADCAGHRYGGVWPCSGGFQWPDRHEADKGGGARAGWCQPAVRSIVSPCSRRRSQTRNWSIRWWRGSIRRIRSPVRWRIALSAWRGSGCPGDDQLAWCGDAASERLYDTALAQLAATGAAIVDVDMAPLKEAALLLYNGPWVAERTAALEGFLADHADAFDPTVRAIVEGGRSTSGTDVFKGMYRLAELQRCRGDVARYRYAGLAHRTDDLPHRGNARGAAGAGSNLRIYTNFVNLLDGRWRCLRVTGIIAPVSAYADRPGMDPDPGAAGCRACLPRTGGYTRAAAIGSGGCCGSSQTGRRQCPSRRDAAALATDIARCAPDAGDADSRHADSTPLADSVPFGSALVHAADGAAIAVEVYELDVGAFGSFVAEVPAPLAIGTVTLADGSQVKGFVGYARWTGQRISPILADGGLFVASTVSVA